MLIKTLQLVLGLCLFCLIVCKEEEESPVSFAGINSFKKIEQWLNVLGKKYPNVELKSLGRTSENRSITVVSIRPRSSNATEETPAIFIDAGVHGREQITVSVALNLIKKIVHDDEASNFSKVAWHIITVANPDGYEYARIKARTWRKNRSPQGSLCNGVDLNRNWDYAWGTSSFSEELEDAENEPGVKHRQSRITSWTSWLWSAITNPEKVYRSASLSVPCSELYAGEAPFSEVESKAMADFLRNLTAQNSTEKLMVSLSLHSMTGDQVLLYPYGSTTQSHPNTENLKALSTRISDAIYSKHGVRYRHGPIWEVLYQGNGLQADWMLGTLGVNRTFVMELRDNQRQPHYSKLIGNAFRETVTALEIILSDLS